MMIIRTKHQMQAIQTLLAKKPIRVVDAKEEPELLEQMYFLLGSKPNKDDWGSFKVEGSKGGLDHIVVKDIKEAIGEIKDFPPTPASLTKAKVSYGKMGVVYDPISKQFLYFDVGLGAFLDYAGIPYRTQDNSKLITFKKSVMSKCLPDLYEAFGVARKATEEELARLGLTPKTIKGTTLKLRSFKDLTDTFGAATTDEDSDSTDAKYIKAYSDVYGIELMHVSWKSYCDVLATVTAFDEQSGTLEVTFEGKKGTNTFTLAEGDPIESDVPIAYHISHFDIVK